MTFKHDCSTESAPLAPDALAWNKFINGSRFKINLGQLLSTLKPHVLPWFWVLSMWVLAHRMGMNPELMWGIFGITTLIWMLIIWIKFKKTIFDREDVRRTLDRDLGLHHALHCANKGLSPWPDPSIMGNTHDSYTIRLGKWSQPMLLGLLFVGIAAWVPMAKTEAPKAMAVQPWVMEEVDTWLEALDEDDSFDEKELDTWAEILEELKEETDEDSIAAQQEAMDRLHEEILEAVKESEATLSQLSKEITEAMATMEGMDGMKAGQIPSMSTEASKRIQALREKAKCMQLSWEAKQNKSGSSAKSGKRISKVNASSLPSLKKSLEKSLKQCSVCIGTQPGGNHGQKPGKGGKLSNRSFWRKRSDKM